MKITHCKLKKKVQKELLRFFVLEVTARSAADILSIHPNSAALFYRKIRTVISHHLALAADEVFEGSVELDESYFGGRRKGRRGRGAAGKVVIFYTTIRFLSTLYKGISMSIANYPIIPNDQTGKTDLFLATAEDIAQCEAALNTQFEADYREYVTRYGEGDLGVYLRVYLPEQIMKERPEWLERITRYWFWDEGADVLTKEQVLQSIAVADTLDGDELIWFEGRYYVLPREEEKIYDLGATLGEAITWLFESGVLGNFEDEDEDENEDGGEIKFKPYDPSQYSDNED